MKYPLLYICVAVMTVLWLLRSVVTGTPYYYGFIFLNLFLAAMPLCIEQLFPIIKRRLTGFVKRVSYALAGFTWLLFLPNAFYILTDFMHLNANVLVNMPDGTSQHAFHYMRGDSAYMVDSLLIFVAVIFGGYAGGLALTHAYTFFKRTLTAQQTWLLMSCIVILSSVGIFIGRFGRWNSWEALYMPWAIVGDLYQQLLIPLLRERFFVVVVTGCIFHVLCFYAVRTLATSSTHHA